MGAAARFGSDEYKALQTARKDYPTFKIVTVSRKPATQRDTYKGLTHEYMIAHPSTTVAPTKLEDFGMHEDTCLSSGTIVTGRLVYDCFSLDNKKNAVYYWPVA